MAETKRVKTRNQYQINKKKIKKSDETQKALIIALKNKKE